MKRSIISRIIRIFMVVILGILATGLLSYIILLLPPVQRYAVDFAEKELGSLLLADIRIGSVRANLISTVDLRGIKIRDKAVPDDTIAIGRLRIRYNLAALLTKTVSVPGISIDDVFASISVSPDNTYHIPAVPDALLKDTSGFNLDSLPFRIHIGKVRIRNVNGIYKDSVLNMVGQISGAQIRAKFNRIDSISLQLTIPQGDYRSPWWNGEVDTIGAIATLQFDGLDLIDTYIKGAGSVVRGKGHIAFLEDGIWNLSADIKTDIAPVTVIQQSIPGIKASGCVTGFASWQGTIAKPVLSYNFAGIGFEFESVHIDTISSSGTYSEDNTARFNLFSESSLGRVYLDGSLEIPELMVNPTFGKYKGVLSLDRFMLRKLANDFKVNTGKIPGESGVLSARFSGNGFEHLPEKLLVSGDIMDTLFTGDTLVFNSQLLDNNWNINCRLGTDSICGQGKITIDGPVDGKVCGSVRDLRFFADYFLNQKASGGVFFTADIQGTTKSPAVEAMISGRNLEWNSINVDSLSGKITYSNGNLSLNKISATGKADLGAVSKLMNLDSLYGNAEFSGSCSGLIPELDISARFGVNNLSYKQYSIDSVTGKVAVKKADSVLWSDVSLIKDKTLLVSNGTFTITKNSGDVTTLWFDKAEDQKSAGSIAIHGFFQGDSLESTVSVSSFNPEILLPWIKEVKGYPGRVNASVQAGGKIKNLHGHLSTEIYKPDDLKKWLAELHCNFGLVDSSLQIASDINLSDSSRFHLNANLPLTSKAGLLIDTSSNRFAAASIEGSVANISDLTSFLGDKLRASGHSVVKLNLNNKNGDWDIGGTVDVNNGSFTYFPDTIQGTGCNLNISLGGTIAKPEINYTVSSGSISMPQAGIDSMYLSGKTGLDTLTLESATLYLPGKGKLELTLKVPLMNLDSILEKPGLEAEFVVARFPIKLLAPFFPEYTITSGVCKGMGKLRVYGGRPVMIGRLNFYNCKFGINDIEPQVGPVEAEVVFADDSLQLQWLNGKWGKKGTFQGNGYAIWNQSGIDDMRTDLRFNTLALDLPDLAEIMVQSGNLYVTSKKGKYLVGGILELGESRIIRDLRISDLLDQFQSSTVASSQVVDSLMQDISLKIDVKFLEDLRVDMNLGKLQLDGGITIAGTAAKPTYTGEIHVTQGYILYLDRQFEITKGSFYNYNPYELNPLLDIEASTEVISVSNVVENYTIKMSIKGDLQKPEFRLWAENLPFDEADIMSILTVGRPLGAIGGDLGDRLRTFASSSLLGFGTRKLEQLLGMDKIDIDGDIFNLAGKKSKSSDSLSTAPHLTLAKRITPRLMLSYETDLQDFAKMKVSALFKLTKWLFLQGNGGSEDYSLDLLFKFSK